MEKKLDTEKLLPSYFNLDFDIEPVAGPSAPATHEEDGQLKASSGYERTPSAPILESRPDLNPLTYNSPSLQFEDIYEACMNYVEDHCCYGSRFVRQMKLIEIQNKCAFHYVLDSYGEKRESAYMITPYKGQPIDGPENGPPPDPWDMVVPLPSFVNAKSEIEIPHTAYVKQCEKCLGNGMVTCSFCGGIGRSICPGCGGTGRGHSNNFCTSCGGCGTCICWSCGGMGRVTCNVCEGSGHVKYCKVLIVTWTNHSEDVSSEIHNLPLEKLRKVKSDILFYEEDEKVLPIANAPDAFVNIESTRMVKSHKVIFPGELIRRQRHLLRAAPLTRVIYEWKDKMGEFYVYGKEKSVYFEDYPQKCCCCTIC